MALDSIIRNAVATLHSVTSSLRMTVTLERWISDDAYNKPTYDDPETLSAIVEFRNRLRRGGGDKEVVNEAHLTFTAPIASNGASHRREPIDPRDKITLSNGFTGPILDIRGPGDPSTDKPYAIDVVLGEFRT